MTLTDPEPAEPTNATINYELGDDKMEGNGSFRLKYMFTGSSLTAAPEKVYFEQTWGDWRFDLSFYPLGLSIWVKGNKDNKGVFRFVLLEDKMQFSAEAPHDNTRKRWSYYVFEDKDIPKGGKTINAVRLPKLDKSSFTMEFVVSFDKLEKGDAIYRGHESIRGRD